MKKLIILLAATLLLCACADSGESQSKPESSSATEISSSEAFVSEEFSAVTADNFKVWNLEMPLFAEFTTQEVDDLDLYAYNDEMIVVATYDKFSDLNESNLEKIKTTEDYANAFIDSSGVSLNLPLYVDDENNKAWAEYTQEMPDGMFHYFAFFFTGSDAFYNCQFICAEEDADTVRDTVYAAVDGFILK